MLPLGVTLQHVLQDCTRFRQAPAADCHCPAFHEHFNDQCLGERQGVECVEAGLNFLPELSLRQTVNTGEELLRIWRSRRLWQAGQEFAAMTQGQGRLLVTGMRLTQTLQNLSRKVELATIFVYLAEESHHFSMDGRAPRCHAPGVRGWHVLGQIARADAGYAPAPVGSQATDG